MKAVETGAWICGVDEAGHHGGVGMVWRLERAEHVEEAEGQHWQPVRVAPCQGVGLGGELAGRVRRHGSGGQLFVFGQGRVGAVHAAAAGDDDVQVAVPSCRFQHLGGAVGVGGERGEWCGDAAWHAADGGELTPEKKAEMAAAKQGGGSHGHEESGGASSLWMYATGVLFVLLLLSIFTKKSRADDDSATPAATPIKKEEH